MSTNASCHVHTAPAIFPQGSGLTYDPTTGIFKWLTPPRKARRVKPGDLAGTVNRYGYVVITVGGVKHRAHRLAWLFVTGSWPTEQIDHINGVRADNRFVNLRDVGHEINVHNRRRANRNSNTGVLGVTPYKGKFAANIYVAGRHKRLGRFATVDAAYAAYRTAKAALHEGSTL